MKIIKRFYDDDLRELLMEKYDLRPEQVTSTFTQDVDFYGNTTDVFYIEVEEDE